MHGLKGVWHGMGFDSRRWGHKMTSIDISFPHVFVPLDRMNLPPLPCLAGEGFVTAQVDQTDRVCGGVCACVGWVVSASIVLTLGPCETPGFGHQLG